VGQRQCCVWPRYAARSFPPLSFPLLTPNEIPIPFYLLFADTGCETASESVPLQSALTAAVRTSVGVTEISLTSSSTSKTNNEQVAQL